MYDQITELINLIEISPEPAKVLQAIEQLGKIGHNHELAISTLINLIRSTSQETARWMAMKSLSQIAVGRADSINTFVGLLSSDISPTRQLAAQYLISIMGDSPTAIMAAINLLYTNKDEKIRQAATLILGKVKVHQSEAIDALVFLIYNSHDENTILRVIAALSSLKARTLNVIFAYLYLIKIAEECQIKNQAIQAITDAVLTPEIMNLLSKLQEDYIRKQIFIILHPALLPLNRGHRYLDLVLQELAKKIGFTQTVRLNELTKELIINNIAALECYLIAAKLGEIGVATNETIESILEILQEEQPAEFRLLGYYSLARMSASNSSSTLRLIELISKVSVIEDRQAIVAALGKVESGHLEAINALINLINFPDTDELICYSAIRSLHSLNEHNYYEVYIALDTIQKNHSKLKVQQLAAKYLGKIF